MRLADAGRADQTETLAGLGKLFGELARLLHRAQQFFVRIHDERFEIAPLVTRRNTSVVQQTRRKSFTPAIASDDTADAVGLNSLPAGIVAKRAGHVDREFGERESRL